MITAKEIIEIIEAESVQENSSSNNRVLIQQDFEYVAEQIVKKLTIPVVSSCFYHPENEGTAKTFRDVSTNNWYYENELINLLGENIVSSIKHRFDK